MGTKSLSERSASKPKSRRDPAFLGAYSPPHDEMLENRATSLMRSIIVISALALGFGVLAPRYLSKVGPAPAPAAQEVRTTV
jgi:hypothetical protein